MFPQVSTKCDLKLQPDISGAETGFKARLTRNPEVFFVAFSPFLLKKLIVCAEEKEEKEIHICV